MNLTDWEFVLDRANFVTSGIQFAQYLQGCIHNANDQVSKVQNEIDNNLLLLQDTTSRNQYLRRVLDNLRTKISVTELRLDLSHRENLEHRLYPIPLYNPVTKKGSSFEIEMIRVYNFHEAMRTYLLLTEAFINKKRLETDHPSTSLISGLKNIASSDANAQILYDLLEDAEIIELGNVQIKPGIRGRSGKLHAIVDVLLGQRAYIKGETWRHSELLKRFSEALGSEFPNRYRKTSPEYINAVADARRFLDNNPPVRERLKPNGN